MGDLGICEGAFEIYGCLYLSTLACRRWPVDVGFFDFISYHLPIIYRNRPRDKNENGTRPVTLGGVLRGNRIRPSQDASVGCWRQGFDDDQRGTDLIFGLA